MRKIFVGALFFLLGLGSLAQEPCIKDGVRYGVTKGSFRSRWWNYQERGMSYLDGGCYEQGLKDLEKAIELRKKLVRKDCDQRRARTYGMHFVDYFGHRERGVALYHLGRLEEAKKELEFSLSCVESNKAQYYLDLVRKKELEQSRADQLPPKVEIFSPKEHAYVNQDEIEVSGRARDDYFVKEIWIDDQPVVIPLAEKEILFREKIRLKPGWNRLTIRAVDLTGKEQRRDWTIFLDRAGPQISFQDIRLVAPGEVEVIGRAIDESGIKSLILNKRKVPLEPKSSFQIRLRVAPEYKLWFQAEDLAGNQTKGVVHLIEKTKGAKAEPIYREASLLGDWQVYPRHKETPFLCFEEKVARAQAQVAFTELFWNLKERYQQYLDREPPQIKLRGFKGQKTVYFPEIYLEGLVSDQSGLKSFSINGKNLLRGEQKNLFFNYILRLKPGENRIVLRAVDIRDNIAEMTIKILRVIPTVHRIDERMVVSMLPFYLMGEVQEISPVAYDNLVSAIVEQGRFKFVDRTKVEEIVRELRLSAEELVNPAYTLKVGKLTQAEGMIMGFIREAPDSIEIYAELVDVETGEILTEKDAFDQDKGLDALKYLTRGLSIRLREDFPLIEGKVLEVQGKDLVIDLGRSQKLKPGMRVIFFKELEMIDPESGIKLGTATEKLGLGRIESVYQRTSLVKPLSKINLTLTQENVITK